MFEKRKFPRLGETWELDYRKISPVEFKTSPLSSMTVNISGGGICFETREEVPKGSILALELKSAEFPSPIMALAMVAWCKEQDAARYEVGAEFWWTGWKNNDTQQSILDYISKNITD